MWRKRPETPFADDGMPDLPGMPPRDMTPRPDAADVLVKATDGHPRRPTRGGRGGRRDAEVESVPTGSAPAESAPDESIPDESIPDKAESASQRRGREPPTATARALGLLTRREHSRRELHAKLVARGVTDDEAAIAIDRLGQAGWQSDLRYAESLFRQRRGAGYGPRYIAAELQARGVASATIAQAMSGDDGRDWIGIATEVLQRRLGEAPRDAALRNRALALLLRRGFDNAQAREAWARLLAE
jgi:SOS response regulatory protein OraA/RecX